MPFLNSVLQTGRIMFYFYGVFMPIDWSKSKYSKKHKKFLSKKPEKMKFFTLCDGAARSGKTL